MSIRKRKWTSAKGVAKEAWVFDYVDAGGVRRLQTFRTKKEADKAETDVRGELRDGVHVADSASISVTAAGKTWLVHSEANGLEKTTLSQYRQHLNLHITPFIGDKKLSELSVPTVRAFEDKLRKDGRSPVMIRKVLVSLGSLLAERAREWQRRPQRGCGSCASAARARKNGRRAATKARSRRGWTCPRLRK